MAPVAHICEHLLIREWSYLRRVGRCNLVGVGVALLEKVCLRFQKPKQVRSSVSLFLLPEDLDVELSAIFSTPSLPVYCHAPCHDDKGLTP